MAKTLHVFDVNTELWLSRETTGPPHPGLYNHASVVIGEMVYFFGGGDGWTYFNSLHQLDLEQLIWRNAQPVYTSYAPMKKTNCGMVSFGHDKLVLFAGYGKPSPRVHPGSKFIPNKRVTDGTGFCNEVHLFDIKIGESCVQCVTLLSVS